MWTDFGLANVSFGSLPIAGNVIRSVLLCFDPFHLRLGLEGLYVSQLHFYKGLEGKLVEHSKDRDARKD